MQINRRDFLKTFPFALASVSLIKKPFGNLLLAEEARHLTNTTVSVIKAEAAHLWRMIYLTGRGVPHPFGLRTELAIRNFESLASGIVQELEKKHGPAGDARLKTYGEIKGFLYDVIDIVSSLSEPFLLLYFPRSTTQSFLLRPGATDEGLYLDCKGSVCIFGEVCQRFGLDGAAVVTYDGLFGGHTLLKFNSSDKGATFCEATSDNYEKERDEAVFTEERKIAGRIIGEVPFSNVEMLTDVFACGVLHDTGQPGLELAQRLVAKYPKNPIFAGYLNSLLGGTVTINSPQEMQEMLAKASTPRERIQYFMHFGEYHQALSEASSAIVNSKSDETIAYFHSLRAKACVALELFGGAEEDAKSAISFAPKNPEFHKLLGDIYNELGNRKNAETEKQEAAELYKKAIACFEKALELEPYIYYSTFLLKTLGFAYENLHFVTGEKPYLEKANACYKESTHPDKKPDSRGEGETID